MKLLLVLLCIHVVIGGQPTSPEPAERNHDGPTSEIGRNNALAEELNDIKNLKIENKRLRKIQKELKEKCDDKAGKWAVEYNRLLKLIKRDSPEIKELEERLTNELLKNDALRVNLRQAKVYVSLFSLKKRIMTEDIRLLQTRKEYYVACQEFGSYIGFQPDDEIGTRSFSHIAPGQPLGRASDISRMLYERKRVWLDIQLEQETFQNVELKKFISYYTGFCKRRIDNIRQLIDQLKRYPQGGQGVEELRRELAAVEREIQDKYYALGPLKDKIQDLATAIRELQSEYDQLQNPVNCFLKLDQWHIDGAMRNLEDSLSKAKDLNFGHELLNPDKVAFSSRDTLTFDPPTINKTDVLVTLKPTAGHEETIKTLGTTSVSVTHNTITGHEGSTNKPVSSSGATTEEGTTVTHAKSDSK